MIPGSSHSLQFTRAPLYSSIHLGQRLNLISALNCFVAVSYGTGVRAAARIYTDLQTALPLFPHQTRHEIYMARLSTNTGPLIGEREMFILWLQFISSIRVQELVCKFIRKCKSWYLFGFIWRFPVNVNLMKSTISLMLKSSFLFCTIYSVPKN